MKKKILIGITIGLVLIAGILAYLRSATKKHSPAAVATYQQNGLDITIAYCRPYKKGRVIFGPQSTGALQPFGTYWRVGANEATTIETKTPLIIEGKQLPAGKYAMYAIPEFETWTIAFNTENDRWGVPAPDEKNDVLRVVVPSQQVAEIQEQFEISFIPTDSMVQLQLYWDNTKVKIPLTLGGVVK